jgi:hypothetical protein
LEVIGISPNHDPARVAALMKKKRVAWPWYCDPKGENNPFAREFGIVDTPVGLLVDKQGTLRDANVNFNHLDAAKAALLAE